MNEKIEMQLGTLALMQLKTLDILGPLHGFGLAKLSEPISSHIARFSAVKAEDLR